MGTMVWLGPNKGREEGMMNVNNGMLEGAAKIIGDDLHVSGQYDEIDADGLHQCNFFVLLLALRCFCDFEDLITNVELFGHRTQIVVIRDDECDFTRQLSGFVPQKELPNHVVVLGNHNTDLLLGFAPIDGMRHPEPSADLTDAIVQRRLIGVKRGVIEHDPLEEAPRFDVGVLLRIDNVTAMTVEQLPKRGHYPLAIGADDAHRSNLGRGSSSRRRCCVIIFRALSFRHDGSILWLCAIVILIRSSRKPDAMRYVALYL
mmetsp:Transcript_25867/g.74809  ORF Transcript_25867/g.74809 Transcript_25867/m.74809 type:complete len:260 (-) Transcript_25867:37-816(-)